MNFLPAGDESSDDEVYINLSANAYDERGYQTNEKEEEEQEKVEVVEKSPGDFLTSHSQQNSVAYGGENIRFFSDFRNAIILQNTPFIEDFCQNVPNWESMADDTGFTAVDYAIGHARPLSLSTLYNHSKPKSSALPIGFLYSKSLNNYGDGADDDAEVEAEKCMHILKSCDFNNTSLLFMSDVKGVTKNHKSSSMSSFKSSKDLLLLFLQDIHLSFILPSFTGVSFHSFLLMDEDDFIKLGISQAGILSRLTDAILNFHLFPWKSDAVLNKDNVSSMSGLELASMIHNMCEHLKIMDCSIQFTEKRMKKAGEESSQAYKFQMLQLENNKAVLAKEILELKKKFESFYRSRKSQKSFIFKFFCRTILLTTLPLVTIFVYYKVKASR